MPPYFFIQAVRYPLHQTLSSDDGLSDPASARTSGSSTAGMGHLAWYITPKLLML